MYSSISSAAHVGLHGHMINVEVHIANGLPRFKIVGLPDKSVMEAQERVTTAIKSSGYTFPLKRITVNLTPTHLPKHGTSYDLPIALGILTSSRQIPPANSNADNHLYCGELGLDGKIRKTMGIPIAIQTAIDNKATSITIPSFNEALTSAFTGITIYTAEHLNQCTDHILGRKPLASPSLSSGLPNETRQTAEIFESIGGNTAAKRAITIAAAGSHNVSLTGPPGCGKTLLAQAVSELLPPRSTKEKLESLKIYSLSPVRSPAHRPFRTPHHTASLSTILGGGPVLAPGELSLAHNGILFLDELPQFSRNIIHSLHQPLDQDIISLSYRQVTVEFPAKFILITAMNPCPCGFRGHPQRKCTCTAFSSNTYLRKIPESLWDRIDINLFLHSEKYETLISQSTGNSKEKKQICRRISRIWHLQRKRNLFNNKLEMNHFKTQVKISNSAQNLIKESHNRLGLSTRGLLKTIRVGRTIADLDDSGEIKDEHIAEAISYRKI